MLGVVGFMYGVNIVSKGASRGLQSAFVWLAISGLLLTLPPAFAAGLTNAQLLDVTLDTPDWEGDGVHPLKFTNGDHKHEYGTDRIIKTTVGDLNGDGLADGAVVYYVDGGGTGAFMRMAVFVCKGGKPVQVGMRTLGDRTKTNKLTIKNGVLELDIMVHAPGDSAPSPTKHKVVHFKVKKDKLVGPEEVE